LGRCGIGGNLGALVHIQQCLDGSLSSTGFLNSLNNGIALIGLGVHIVTS
jgi:hypothetical protein